MEMARECTSFTFNPIHTLLSAQTGFSFVRAAVAYSILERISGLDHKVICHVSRSSGKRLLQIYLWCLDNLPKLWNRIEMEGNALI